MKNIKFFKELSINDNDKAGGKGASLSEMYNNKIPVPNGFVILSFAYQCFLKENKLDSFIKTNLKKINLKKINSILKVSKEIQSKILKGNFSKELSKDIISSFKKLNSKYVAVRSSATVEDSKENAWAGQLDSYLNVDKRTILEYIKKCFASLFTQRAIFYRFENNLENKKVSVAVVVQKMVNSDVSGIAFSIHPVEEDYNKIIIEAGYGLGEAIVSGQVTPDSYVVCKKTLKILDKNISIQEKALYKCLKKRIKWKSILKKEKDRQKLSDRQIISLSKTILKIEDHYSFPVDIEWAIEKGKIYVTQSRPITTLKKKNHARK
jgi:pyruvate, water dikinase